MNALSSSDPLSSKMKQIHTANISNVMFLQLIQLLHIKSNNND